MPGNSVQRRPRETRDLPALSDLAEVKENDTSYVSFYFGISRSEDPRDGN